MSHKAEVTGVQFRSVNAFVKAMERLGHKCTIGGTIMIHDGRHITNAAVACNCNADGRKYGVGLVANEDGTFKLTGDFQCFGWGLSREFLAAAHGANAGYLSDKEIQDTIIRHTTAETMREAAEAEGYSVEVTENKDGTLELQLETY